MSDSSLGLSLALLPSLLLPSTPVAFFQQKALPGFEQILERGQIASIDRPKFVRAEEAQIAEDSWVMGIVIDGEARAYSLNLLNSHEVVNDEVAGRAIAAVW